MGPWGDGDTFEGNLLQREQPPLRSAVLRRPPPQPMAEGGGRGGQDHGHSGEAPRAAHLPVARRGRARCSRGIGSGKKYVDIEAALTLIFTWIGRDISKRLDFRRSEGGQRTRIPRSLETRNAGMKSTGDIESRPETKPGYVISYSFLSDSNIRHILPKWALKKLLPTSQHTAAPSSGTARRRRFERSGRTAARSRPFVRPAEAPAAAAAAGGVTRVGLS